MSEIKIDLNADLGERPEAYEVDAELMEFISSANIACGGHAGDRETIHRMVELAQSLGVAVGAHPSFPDRKNFGRIAIDIEPRLLHRSLEEQVGLVAEVAARAGVNVSHVKPHGALYHSASSDAMVAQTIVDAVRAVDGSLIVVAQYGSPAVERFRHAGLRTATEAFADRGYERDGTLRNRALVGALLDVDQAVAQALGIVLHHQVNASDDKQLDIRPDTLCFHSDTPNSTLIAKRVREALEAASVRIARL